MDETLKVILIITSLSFIVFIIFMMFIFLNINKSLNDLKININKLIDELIRSIKLIDDDLNSLKKDITESLNNINQTSTQITTAAKSFEIGFNGLSDTINRYKNVANTINDIIMKPVSNIALYSSALSKAISTFKGFMKRR